MDNPRADANQAVRPDKQAILREMFSLYKLSLQQFDHLEKLVNNGSVCSVEHAKSTCEFLGAEPKTPTPGPTPPGLGPLKPEQENRHGRPGDQLPASAFQSPPARHMFFDISSPPGAMRSSQHRPDA